MQRLELIPGLSRLLNGISHSEPARGWSGLDWGEDFSRVKNRFPDAVASGSGLRLSSPESGPDLGWDISFAFDSNRQLESVSLSYAGSRETADFASLSEQLNQRFGAPVSSTETSQTWQKGGASITLSREPGGGVVFSATG
jgi:hypothetical protein